MGIIFRYKKTLSFTAAFILLQTSVSAELIRTDSIDEYIDVTTSFINEADNSRYYSPFKISEVNDFENCRLLLLSDYEFDYRNADMVIASPDGQYVLSFPTAQAAAEAYNYYISQGLTVIPDVTFSIEETADSPFYTLSTHISYGPGFIHADEFNELLLKKYGAVENMPEIRIAVADTGANYNHELLKDRVDTSAGYNFTIGDSDALDDHGHGSHVCGIIADNTLSNVTIVPYKTMKSNGTGTASSLINAINKAVSSGNIDIFNLSLGSKDSTKSLCAYLTPYFKKAYNNGIISVVAAGNDQTDANYSCPANITDYTIAVSACNSAGEFASGYSNYGSAIDFCSPGSSIYSSLHTSATAYGYKSGTSMASPSAVSAFAMLKTYYPAYSVSQLEKTMQDNAIDAGNEGFDNYYGYGYASMEKLIEALTLAETPTAAPTAAPTATPTAAPTATPTAAPTATPIAAPTAAPTAAGFTVTINNITVPVNTDSGYAVIASASYDDNGILTGLEIRQVSETCGITFDNYSKIFIFDSLQGMKPLYSVITK